MIDGGVFTEHRQLLFGVAYRMTGSVADAEDLVQEAWLRWSTVDQNDVRNPRAFLVRTITNLALNQLTSARARREEYVGPWLPEPLLVEDDATGEVEMAESLSMAMLVVLETLTPVERAVFLLHDVFGYSHDEIAEMVNRSPVSVRQTATRARAHVAARRPRVDDGELRWEAVRRFRDACAGGDLGALMDLLAPDVVAVADGGGRVSAARRPLVGADHVGRWILGVMQKPGTQELAFRITLVNGEPALLALIGDHPVGSVAFEVGDGLITHIWFMINPEKLNGLRSRSVGGPPGP